MVRDTDFGITCTTLNLLYLKLLQLTEESSSTGYISRAWKLSLYDQRQLTTHKERDFWVSREVVYLSYYITVEIWIPDVWGKEGRPLTFINEKRRPPSTKRQTWKRTSLSCSIHRSLYFVYLLSPFDSLRSSATNVNVKICIFFDYIDCTTSDFRPRDLGFVKHL